MATVLGVCGRKGGSGKTTVAVHLAAELATRGQRVVLIDCDPQGSAKHWSAPGQLPMPVQHRPIDPAKVAAWSQAVRSIAADVVVLDSPPHLDAALGGVIGLADVAVVPCGPSGLDLIATAETVALVREIREARGGGKPVIALVPNRVDKRTASGRQLTGALEDMGELVAPSIHARTALADSFNLCSWVGAYAPGSTAHKEICALTTFTLKLVGQKPGKR